MRWYCLLPMHRDIVGMLGIRQRRSLMLDLYRFYMKNYMCILVGRFCCWLRLYIDQL